MNTTTIRPGILVAIRTSVTGGVSYERDEIAPDETPAPSDETTAKVEAWKTTKLTVDAAEHDRAIKIRSLALREVTKHCTLTSFGLIAPQANEAALDESHGKARAMIDEFNATARYTKIAIGLLKGRIASTDEEAVKAISAEVGAIVGAMNRAIDRLDVEAIREAARKASNMAAILGDSEQATVSAAVEAARKAARAIVKIQKSGQVAAVILNDAQRDAISKARIAFLDMDAPAEREGDEMPAADMARVAALDLDDAPAVETPAPVVAPALDFDDGPAIVVSAPEARPALDFE